MEKKATLKATMAVLLIALVVTSGLLFVLMNGPDFPESKIKTFDSNQELIDYINQSSLGYEGGINREFSESAIGGDVVIAGAESADASAVSGKSSADDFSTTNIQVEGVDEPDIVKNDGKYIYVVSGKKVVIVNAFPAEDMKILSELEFEENVRNIFINEDKLIVFSNFYKQNEIQCIRAPCPSDAGYKTGIFIYDISDHSNPELDKEIEADGNYRDARMIGDYVYVVSNKYINRGIVSLPGYRIDGIETTVEVEDVSYFPYPDSNYVFTNIMSINVDKAKFNSKVFLTGSNWNMYVSENNIYLTGNKYISMENYLDRLVEDVFLDILPSSERNEVKDILDSDEVYYEKLRDIGDIIGDYSASLRGSEKEDFDKDLLEKTEQFEIEISKEREKTTIHKISIDKEDISYEGVGEVPGRILNQFSMDEHKGNLRIATTTGNWRATSLNHLYVLDEDLEIIGSVEDLAKGERIYSSRFMGDRAYMVTFRQVDPLYVIDLSDAKDPEVLGYLKVTGYSSYLHPYDENHIIGVGKEASEEGRIQGVKIALFDVSDVENPIEKAKYEVEGMYSNSNALYDHKAFLFDKEKELLVLPMSYRTEVSYDDFPNNAGVGPKRYEYWQGAFVFNINLDDGITLQGKIEHNEDESEEVYYYGISAIQRSLFMDNILYTISRAFIKANDLSDLDYISKVKLPYEETRYYGYNDDLIAIEPTIAVSSFSEAVSSPVQEVEAVIMGEINQVELSYEKPRYYGDDGLVG